MSHTEPNLPRWLCHPVRDGSDWMARSRDLVARSTALTVFAPDRALFGCTFELCTVFDLADRMPYPHLRLGRKEAFAQLKGGVDRSDAEEVRKGAQIVLVTAAGRERLHGEYVFPARLPSPEFRGGRIPRACRRPSAWKHRRWPAR